MFKLLATVSSLAVSIFMMSSCLITRSPMPVGWWIYEDSGLTSSAPARCA